ncbi:MAG TPA: hypothetical protein VGY55_09260 [Pirellulales bacterium]|jgi:hypothetical protein|nr:hypothetical protein [Pirellulales bacterium]
MKLRFSRRRLLKRVRAVSSRLLNRFYWRETKYYYFGEFGYFNLEVLGGLQGLFLRRPELRLKICTYPSYAELLRSRFPDHVECVSPDWSFDERRRVCHRYNCRRFHWALFRQGFNHELQTLFDDLPNRGRVHLARFFYLNSPLTTLAELQCCFDTSGAAPTARRGHEVQRGMATQGSGHGTRQFSIEAPSGIDSRRQYISIFPRGRHGFASKNLDAGQWEAILRRLAELTSLPIVVHGLRGETLEIPMADSFIRPNDILEQVYYLNHSRFCVSSDSGFVQFALNCGCDVLVIGGTIQYHEFVDFNPFGKRLVITSPLPEEYLPALKEFVLACEAEPSQLDVA